ncbi:hypothetical protein V8C44DRAFT_325849 [Trichoderma aethiopicum]
MAPRRPNPDDFISLLSSEDEAPLTRKRKYSEEDPAGGGGERASKGRAKRARASSASVPSLTGAKRIKAGKADAVKSADIRESGFGAHVEEKNIGVFSPDTVFLPKAPPIFTIDSISLQLPVFSPKREGTWLTRFTEWAQLLCSANRNSPNAGEITPAVIRTAYKQYIDIHSRLKSNKKRAARLVAQQFKDSSLLDLIRAFPPLHNEAAQLTAAVEEAFEESSEATSAGLDIRLDAPRPLALSPQIQFLSSAAAAPDVLTEQSDALYMIDVAPQLVQNTTVRERLLVTQPELLPASQPKHFRQTQQFSIEASMSLQSAIPSGAEALRQQRLYFPSAKDPSNMCLLCGGEGHIADNCTRSCRFCGEKGHWDHCCPSWALYCENCYRPGHLEATCWDVKERHWGVCAYCRSGDHHSSQNCMTLYRSFRPGPDTIKKVNSLPVSCAACGSRKHFHGDCPNFGVFGLRRDHRFHLDNMRQYLDPTSSAGPIVGTAACQKTPKAGGFRVSGRVLASPVDNVQYYSGSDDSDEGLCVVTSPVPSRRYNFEPPPPCLQSPSSDTHQSPPARQTSPSIDSIPSRPDSPWTPSPARLPRYRGAATRSGRGGRGGGRGGTRSRQNELIAQSGEGTQDVQVHRQEDVHSGQGEQNGRRSRGKRTKRGGQTDQGGQGHQGGSDVHNIHVDQGDITGPGKQDGQAKGGKRRQRRGRNSPDGRQGGHDGQTAQDGTADQADQAGQVGAGQQGGSVEQNSQGKRGKRRGRGRRGGPYRQIDTSW